MDFVIVFADNRDFLPLTTSEAKVAADPCEDMLVRDGMCVGMGLDTARVTLCMETMTEVEANMAMAVVIVIMQ
eukprot:10962810-Lingulodinium_polyedra.AAC.1